MAIIVDGKRIAAAILENLKPRVETIKKRGIKPALAVVRVGQDQPSITYIRRKEESAQKVGVDFFKFEYPETISKEQLIKEIIKIQAELNLSGMILQLPVPEKLWPYTHEIVNYININIDVDCLSHLALGRVMMNESQLTPPTPGAILEILKFYQVDLTGKEVCLIGRGDLIGKPLSAMLLHEPVTLVTCGKSTVNLSYYTKSADVVITGVGKKDLLTGKMIKKGAVVIDAGVSFESGKMYGDIDFKSVSKKAAIVTPTPGGVGPVTVAKLLENTVKVAENLLNFGF